jgi:hypothetical protein
MRGVVLMHFPSLSFFTEDTEDKHQNRPQTRMDAWFARPQCD